MAEKKIFRLTGNSFVYPGPTNIGVVRSEQGVFLIDSGNDTDAGRRLLRELRDAGLSLKAVINTHSNADHIGANAYLQNSTGCEIWAPDIEAAFTENPLLESSFLWGGYPLKSLRSKFFQAKPSRVNRIVAEESEWQGGSFIPLPGHFFGQFGVLSGDGVFYLGDSLFGAGVIKKYGLPFIYDVGAYIRSIERIIRTEAQYYVPSHGEIVKDIRETAELNLDTVASAEKDLLKLLEKEMIFEDLLKSFCDLRGIILDHGQYVLLGSTLKSFLAHLNESGKAVYEFRNNMMYWRSEENHE